MSNDLNQEQQTELVKTFVQSQFVEKGMVADVNIHRDKSHNPHAHIMLTMRPFNDDGTWGEKRPFTGRLDEKGKKIYQDNPWDHKENVLNWRNNYQDLVNKTYERFNLERRFDLRSYERQGRDEIGTVHLGHVAAGMEKRAQQKALQQGIEYQSVSKEGKLNLDIQNANRELRKYQHELAQIHSNIIDLEQKKHEMEMDIRRSLKKSGLWNNLSPQEKTAITFVRNRMKEEVSFSVALKCHFQFENWEKALEKKMSAIKAEASIIDQSKELYNQYKNSPDNTIAKDRAEIHLKRDGFSIENYMEQLKERTLSFRKNLASFKVEKEKFIENKAKVDEAVKVLEGVTLTQAKILYKDDKKLKEIPIHEVDKLLQEYRKSGTLIPLDKAHEYLMNKENPKPLKEMSLLDQYDKFRKDNQFVVNWIRSLDKKETAAEEIRLTNPAEYAKRKEEMEKQRVAVAERLKHVKTSLSILEKAMISQVKSQYPNDSRLDHLDGKTAVKILRANEKEQRVIPIDEFMKYLDKTSQDLSDSHGQNQDHPDSQGRNIEPSNQTHHNRVQAEMMSSIATSINNLMDDSEKGRKTNIERALEENKYRRKNNDGRSR
ncbi:MobA/MobL family protein [Neobacillus pocheonensis]|uniref:MobA/MobL family protein n=1 Tax=Neobacillus pocheonensis TaxID=363869 RepID=A0ABT0WD47_9BACI|nr:MobA/MobL family protein [Neobacillus pocheonensis]